jgi:hypothetical protein
MLWALPRADNQHVRARADCGPPVTESDPFIRYRRESYRAHGCAESNPPVLRGLDSRPAGW